MHAKICSQQYISRPFCVLFNTFPVTMPRLTPKERWIAIHLKNEGLGAKKIVKKLEERNIIITKKAVQKILKKYKETGNVADTKFQRSSTLHSEDHKTFINGKMREVADMSAHVLTDAVNREFGLTCSVSTVSRFRASLGWRQRKTRYCQLIRDVNKDKRVEWSTALIQSGDEFDVSIDV